MHVMLYGQASPEARPAQGSGGGGAGTKRPRPEGSAGGGEGAGGEGQAAAGLGLAEAEPKLLAEVDSLRLRNAFLERELAEAKGKHAEAMAFISALRVSNARAITEAALEHQEEVGRLQAALSGAPAARA